MVPHQPADRGGADDLQVDEGRQRRGRRAAVGGDLEQVAQAAGDPGGDQQRPVQRRQRPQHRQGGRQDEGQGQRQAAGADRAAPDQRGERVVARDAARGDELGREATGREQPENGADRMQAAARADDDDDADEGDAGGDKARHARRLLQDPRRQRQHQQGRQEVDGGGFGLGDVAERGEEHQRGQEHRAAAQELFTRLFATQDACAARGQHQGQHQHQVHGVAEPRQHQQRHPRVHDPFAAGVQAGQRPHRQHQQQDPDERAAGGGTRATGIGRGHGQAPCALGGRGGATGRLT
ncbi:Uncharacterised protein [Achromobacter ruhlandii]|nr:Uncharacterised protein [Achromobacter ruhlandii]